MPKLGVKQQGRFVTLRSGQVIFIPAGKKSKWADVRDKIKAGEEGPALKATNFFDRKDRGGRPPLTAAGINDALSKMPEPARRLLADVDIKVYSDQFLPEEARGAGAFHHRGVVGVSSSFSPKLGADRLLHELGHAAVDKLGPEFAGYVHAEIGRFLSGDTEEDVADWFADYAAGKEEPIWAGWFGR